MSWRAGRFDRESMPLGLRPFSPGEAVEAIGHIEFEELVKRGKRLVLLDIDNTLLPWRAEEISQSAIDWLEEGKALGLRFCILSNTRHVNRLQRLSEKLDVPFIRDRFKPSRRMYSLALEKFRAKPEEAIMIGDQLFTDVLGANRAGIDSIWVRQIGTHEFFGTKWFSRRMERIVQLFLNRFIETVHSHTDAGLDAELPILRTQGTALQFGKFLVVGVSSFLIDYMISLTLQFAVTVNGVRISDTGGEWLVGTAPALFGWAQEPSQAFWPFAVACGASLAIVNSFIWNRRWTFGIKGPEERGTQFRKFVFVSLIGLALNVLLSTVFFSVLPFDAKNNGRLAKVLAAGIVAVWNFAGQKFFAFRGAATE